MLVFLFFLIIRRPPRSNRTDTTCPDTTPLPICWLGHIGRGGFLAVSISNVGRAVPTLALLAILVRADWPGTAYFGPYGRAGLDRKRTPSELQSLMRRSYAVLCFKKQKTITYKTTTNQSTILIPSDNTYKT